MTQETEIHPLVLKAENAEAMEAVVIDKIKELAAENAQRDFSSSIARDIGREIITARIAANIKPVVQALMDAAIGEYREERVKGTGEIRRYQSPPNVAAATYLINQLIGKPIEQIEVEQHTTVIVDV